MRFFGLVVILTSLAGAVSSANPAATPAPDPYLWLEDVHGTRAIAWVKAENAKTQNVLEKDPVYASVYADALRLAQAKDRIPYPTTIRNEIYNFWQDDRHVQGIWRRTTPADYAKAVPAWETVLDLDALSKTEKANWVWQGANCLFPTEKRCLVSLSNGGEDASTVREFDLGTRTFVRGGFVLSHGKQSVDWIDEDTIIAAREWAPGELTTSGYAYIVKRVRRGDPLSKAVEVFRASTSDVGASPFVLRDGQGDRAILIDREISTFTTEHYLLTPSGPRKLNMPLKTTVSALIAGRLLITLAEDWKVEATTFARGSLVAVDLAAATADPGHLKPALVYKPGSRETLDSTSITRSHVILTTYENVRGRAFVYSPAAQGAWSNRRLDLPDNSSIGVIDTNLHNDNAFLVVTSFLTPSTLWRVDANTGSGAIVKALPPKFDASRDVVEQREATSRDGTRIPYFIVHPKTMTLDGSNPTLLTAYGGFQISETPFYDETTGKVWLERGGVFVLANIRGGGEFGPAWHEAGLTTHRQRIYDDFAAVAEDLISTKVTSPRRLGIVGGSNGGLLMGVEFTQHPELFHAVDIEVPLLDMLRYERIQAGSSWVGEYGSVSNPVQRAFLAKISPYNNLRAGVKYPEPLIWTTTKDDRVGPQHARKFAAKLSALGVPYLFYEVIEGGHGAGANAKERAHTSALAMTYFIQKLMP
jgi:prolyl oligopeptidase